MGLRPINTLKAWAIPHWKPLATQVIDWFDSFWHKSEMIPISSIDNLTEILNELQPVTNLTQLFQLVYPFRVELTGNGVYVLPAGLMITDLLITPIEACDIKVGTTPGGEEVMMERTFEANEDWGVTIQIPSRVDKTIYFTGIIATTTILIWYKTLTPIN